MWGQVNALTHFLCFNGIIPTRVGTRVCRSGMTAQEQDHPHACGDKKRKEIGKWRYSGSSPRVWGQVSGCIMSGAAVRIIPTRVGTSSPRTVPHFFLTDHPHACGDKWMDEDDVFGDTGSSPRVWGQDYRRPVQTL